jgi:hypothetical protein
VNKLDDQKKAMKKSILTKIKILCKNALKSSVTTYVNDTRSNMNENYDIKNATKANIEASLKAISASSVVQEMIKDKDLAVSEVKKCYRQAKDALIELMDEKKVNQSFKDALYAADPDEDLDIEGAMGFADDGDMSDGSDNAGLDGLESWSVNPSFNRPELIHHAVRFINTYIDDKEFVEWVRDNLDKVRATLTNKSLDSKMPIFANPSDPSELHEAMDLVEDEMDETLKLATTMKTPSNITVSISNEVDDIEITDFNASELSVIKNRIKSLFDEIYKSITTNLDKRATIEALEFYIFKVIHLYLLDKGEDDSDITETDDNMFLLKHVSVLSYTKDDESHIKPEIMKTVLFASMLGLVPDHLFMKLNDCITDYRHKHFDKDDDDDSDTDSDD